MLLNCGVGEDSWESLGLQGDPTSQSWRKSVVNIHWWPILWPPDAKNWFTGKDHDAGKDWTQEEKGTTEDETVRRHHRLDEREGGLACYSPWGSKESWTHLSDRTELLYNDSLLSVYRLSIYLIYLSSLGKTPCKARVCSTYMTDLPSNNWGFAISQILF